MTQHMTRTTHDQHMAQEHTIRGNQDVANAKKALKRARHHYNVAGHEEAKDAVERALTELGVF